MLACSLGEPRFLGYIIQRFRVYGGQVASGYAKYLPRIEKGIRSDVVSVLRSIDEDLAPVALSQHKLGEAKDFASIANASQSEGVPMKDVSVGTPSQRQEAEKCFLSIARTIVSRTGPLKLMSSRISRAEMKQVDELVSTYKNDTTIRRFLRTVVTQIQDAVEKDGPLAGLVHSLKYRIKDPEHLKEKLLRKLAEQRGAGRRAVLPAPDNLSLAVTDLAGCRLLHLHTKQMQDIHTVLLKLIGEAQCELFETPFAYVWDDRRRKYGVGGLRPEASINCAS